MDVVKSFRTAALGSDYLGVEVVGSPSQEDAEQQGD